MRTGQRISSGYTAPAPSAPRPERRLSNPVQRTCVTFAETAEETRGHRTVVVVEMEPGSRDGVHCHTTFEERFEVLDGEIVLTIGGTDRTLRRGETENVKPGVAHAVANRGGRAAQIRVDVTPGHTGYERSLRIRCGLARDGQLDEDGKPRNPFHLAVVHRLGDTCPGPATGSIMPMVWLLGRIARAVGIERRLIARYCVPGA